MLAATTIEIPVICPPLKKASTNIFYNILDHFLQISAPFSTNVRKIFYKSDFLKVFYKLQHAFYKCHFSPDLSTNYIFHQTSLQITTYFSTNFRLVFYKFAEKRSKNDTVFSCFWTVSALTTSKNPKKNFARFARRVKLVSKFSQFLNSG